MTYRCIMAENERVKRSLKLTLSTSTLPFGALSKMML